MPDYNAIATRSAKLIARFGAPAVLERAIKGDYDPNVGELDDEGTQVFNTVAVRSEYSKRDIDGTRILAGDVRFYLAPTLATEPLPGDMLTFDGAEFVIISSSPIKPGTVVVLHDVQARNA